MIERLIAIAVIVLALIAITLVVIGWMLSIHMSRSRKAAAAQRDWQDVASSQRVRLIEIITTEFDEPKSEALVRDIDGRIVGKVAERIRTEPKSRPWTPEEEEIAP